MTDTVEGIMALADEYAERREHRGEDRTEQERAALRAAVERLAAPAPDDARDAARYRWLRGGADVPTHSARWGRWEINHWQGANGWRNLLCAELDAAIDEAMKEKA